MREDDEGWGQSDDGNVERVLARESWEGVEKESLI